MSLYLLTAEAQSDLLAIWSFIAQDNMDAADRVEEQIYAACAFLAITPQAGHVRRDLTSLPILFWTLPRFSRYIIAYDSVARPLRIIRFSTDPPTFLNVWQSEPRVPSVVGGTHREFYLRRAPARVSVWERR